MCEKTVKEKPAQSETENTEMYSLKSYVANIEYFIESSALRNVLSFSTSQEWKNYVLQLAQVESCFDSTEMYSGKCISISLAKKMPVVHSETLFVKSKIICKQFTSLKIFVSDMEVRSHGSHTRSFFTLAPRTRNNHTGHCSHEKQISPMQIIFQS